VAAVLLVPALLILVISLVGLESCGSGGGAQAQTSTNKGSVQIALTGSISAPSGLSVQSLLLNVVSVRVNPSTDTSISDSDPSWQVIAAPPGTTAGEAVPSLTTGGSFGPNGNSVSFGEAQSELQIDLAQLQNTVTFFNTGLIKAMAYGQIELLLDSTTPGVVVPQCGLGTSTGEGCLSYPLTFSPSITSIRTVAPFTVTRSGTQSLVLDVSAQLGPGPVNSTSPLTFTPSICAVPASGSSSCPGAPFTATTQDTFSAVITDTVTGATAKTVVNAELAGTSTIVASAPVSSVNGVFQYTMVLPAPVPGGTASPALYDMFTTTPSRSEDPHASVPVFAGIHSSPQPSPDPFAFNITPKDTRTLSGTVVDACTGQGIPGATLDLYVPATLVGTEDCTVSGAPAPCTTTCGQFVNNPSGSDISPGCVIVGTTSTENTGAYPMPGSATQISAFSVIAPPEAGAEYAVVASASGYNGEILGLNNVSSGLQCPGSQFTKSNGQNPCNFSLEHGTLDLTTDVDSSTLPTSNLNVMVNVEDHGTFNGEAVGSVTIPAGQPSNSAPVPINVPINPPSPGAPLSTPTPVVTGGAATYDLFASVQDLFGAEPQKVSGHRIAVASNVAAPGECGTTSATVSGLACVGHGSIAGTITNPDINTLVVVSKTDTTTGDDVALSASHVPLVTTNPNVAICAPADTYIVAHDEEVPRSTPSAGAPTSVTLATPIVINSPPVTTTPTPVPCQGICSDFSQSNAGQSCLLCQSSGVIANPL
jgi:hypothetical protein